MNDVFIVWFRPPRGRWRKVGETATQDQGWSLMTAGEGGGWYVQAPGYSEPTPQEKPTKPSPQRTEALRWE